MTEFGLGSIHSPEDTRDWTIDALYVASGIDAVAVPPSSFKIPAPFPPVLNQGVTPQCVAYSTSSLKAYEDLRDTGLADFDEPKFFKEIGGTPAGADLRVAFQQLLDVGYPVLIVGVPEKHRISAYYAVPVAKLGIQQAIIAFGGLVLSTNWATNWMRPTGSVLPIPNATLGGHAIWCIGYTAVGLILRNSWGAAWGTNGTIIMPWAYLDSHVKRAWKAVDKIETPPPAPVPTKYSLRFAPKATIMAATLATNGCIKAWTTTTWGLLPSSAPCNAPVIRKGCSSGQAQVTLVTAGKFKGKHIRIGDGVTVSKS